MSETDRLYRYKTLLSHRRAMTADELMAAQEISLATFKRDIEYMRDRLNIPFAWDATLRGYAMTRQPTDGKTFELPGVWFNQQEIHSLLTMIELISKLEPGGLLLPHVAPFKARLEGLLDEGIGSSKEAMNRIRILPMAQRQVSGDYFQMIAHALVQRKRLDIKHFARQTGQTTERQVSPQRLVYYRDNWYMDAYCHLREGLRSFALDALSGVQLVDKAAKNVPEAELREMFETSYGIFSGKNRQVAKLKFTPFRAQWVAREVWHPEQVGEVHADGSYTLEVPYSDERELIGDILRIGSDVKVIAPASLIKQIKEASQKIQQQYN
jgi:predicted DNA-binding transcriptional regulator YafY